MTTSLMKNKHQPVYCSVSSVCLILQGSGSLIFSLSSLINSVFSPIRTVIVSQGDVSDFHHIQGVVGDLIAVRIQDVCVFLSPPP